MKVNFRFYIRNRILLALRDQLQWSMFEYDVTIKKLNIFFFKLLAQLKPPLIMVSKRIIGNHENFSSNGGAQNLIIKFTKLVLKFCRIIFFYLFRLKMIKNRIYFYLK